MIYLFAKREKDPSRAAHSNIVVPAPEGKRFLPYQLAGIEYMLRVFGEEVKCLGQKNGLRNVRNG